jgi:hypothetical protein
MTTTEKLNFTQSEYEQMVFGIYSRWCESVTLNIREYQNVLASSKVNNWFLVELSKIEAEFHQNTDRYVESNTITQTDFRTCYRDLTYRLFSIKPSALLQELKSTTSSNLRAKGIPVFNHLNCN